MARVLVGVTGGIAAYKACELVRLLVKAGHEVTPLLTPDAERFVTAHTFEALARREAARDLYPHLVDADLFVIAPLSANTLAKLANGLADNLLTQAALAVRGPLVVAPAMNVRMWEHPATQENVARLVARGVEIIGPEAGELAEGEHGPGRMTEPEIIFARCQELLSQPATSGRLRGKSVVISAGGTREPIDLVRFIGNRSSGRMGVALAAEAQRRGANVTLVYANGSVPPPPGVEVVSAPTAADLRREMLTRADADIVLMAAAVADYRPRKPESGKRPKDQDVWSLDLEPTEDILAELGSARDSERGRVLVGFAADAGEKGLERAREKLANKRGNLFVYNDVSQPGIGFEADENALVLVSGRGEKQVGRRSKEECAVAILDEVEGLLGGG
jgi:phosphopantothenoylcysteine decarboxylase/phosphopantothenate--cysteine ligase